MMKIKRCNKCLMNENYPDISFDANNVCCYCKHEKLFGIKNDNNIRLLMDKKEEFAEDFKRTVNGAKGNGLYDCILPLSGGKDSAYLAYLLKEKHKLKILCITVDTGLMSEIAKPNIERIIKKLGVDHIQITPAQDLYKKLYRYYLSNPNLEKKNHEEPGYVATVCHACHSLMFSFILNEAVTRNIPLIIAGYSPDQIEHYFYEIPEKEIRSKKWRPEAFCRDNEEESKYFWDPTIYPKNSKFPRFLYPFHVMDYPGEEEVSKIVVDLDLIETGKSSELVTNCHMNMLMMYLDIKKLGYNPYAPSFSYKIQQGKATRSKWLHMFEKCEQDPDNSLKKHEEVDLALNHLGLTIDEIL